MAQVSLERVSRVFPGQVKAVDGIDLEVRDGEFLVLVGPSGCGKSTTLRLIAGLERPTEGVIRIGGNVVNDIPCRHRDVSMVFQNDALYPHLDVYENVAFGLKLRNGATWFQRAWWRMTNPSLSRQRAAERRAIPARVEQATASLGIEKLLGRRPSDISGGERQRVAIAKLSIRPAAVSLLDEPLSNLDAQLRIELRRELKNWHSRQPGTTIYVTHDQVEALSLADRIAVMAHGRIEQVGTPRQIYDRPANRFVAGFIGSPTMNFVAGVVRQPDRTESLVFQAHGWAAPLPTSLPAGVAARLNQSIVLGIRPENVYLAAPEAVGRQPSDRQPSGRQPAFDATIVGIEPLGATNIVQLRWSGKDDPQNGSTESGRLLTCVVGRERQLAIGDRVPVWIDLCQAHWFDAETGQNVSNAAPATSGRPAA